MNSDSATWRPAWPDELPLAGDAHVWRARLDRPEPEVDALSALLAPDEQARASRFHFDRDRRDFIVARGLLRLLIGHYLGCVPAEPAFVYGPQGKPALRPDTGLHFNVAHSSGVALFAFAVDGPLGVDVECIRPVEHEALAERFFSQAECAALEHVPADHRHEAFFTVWTRKEAYIKALGGGLSVPLDQFDVSVEAAADTSLVVERKPGATMPWIVHNIDAGPEFRGALAVDKPQVRVHLSGVPGCWV